MRRILTLVMVSGAVAGCSVDSAGGGATGSSPGPMPMTATQTLSPGEACPGGGVKVISGFDADGDGKLSDSEAKSSAVFCADPTILRLVKVSPEPPGKACAAGGQKIEIGLDNGDGGGTAADGELQSGEVDSTTYVCNGVAGDKGIAGKDGVDGKNGTDGQNGTNGADGRNGIDGQNGRDGQNGADGRDGVDGQNGKDGQNGANGRDGVDGQNGKDGQNGADGRDGVDGQNGKDLVHMQVYDAANQLIGHAMTFWALGVTVKTPTGRLVDIGWDGSFYDNEIAYDGAECIGEHRWLRSPSASAYTLSNLLVWDPTTGELYKLVDDDTPGDGMVQATTFEGASIWSYGACYEAPGTAAGWPMVPITRAEAGLPETFAIPLRLVQP